MFILTKAGIRDGRHTTSRVWKCYAASAVMNRGLHIMVGQRSCLQLVRLSKALLNASKLEVRLN